MKSRTDKDLRAQGRRTDSNTQTHTRSHKNTVRPPATLFTAYLTQAADVQHVSCQACVTATRQEPRNREFYLYPARNRWFRVS